MFGHEAIHINLSFTRSQKSKGVEIVEAEIKLINSVLVRIKYLLNVDRLRRVRVHRDV